MKLKDNVVLVTGSGRGIGRAISIAFAAEGAKVALVSRTRREVEETAGLIRRVGGEALPLTADLSVSEEIERCTGDVERQWGPIDVLVNNAAAQGPIGRLWEVDPDMWAQTVHTNLVTPFLLCRSVLPAMIARRRGKIINLSGGGATAPRANFSSYACSKTALVRLTETLADEVQEYNVQVNAIAPGAVSTRMTEQVVEAGAAAGEQELSAANELIANDAGDMDKITALAVYLASQDSDGFTGRLVSAVWDDWEGWQDSLDTLPSDAATLRRIPLGTR